jgi:acetyltransferase-like isoleucine patch superfamily enzyme
MSFKIGENCKIHATAIIDVKEGFIGGGAVIGEGVRIEGFKVEIGREAFLDRFACIGGGSCFDPDAYLKAKDWLHMGVQSQINIARGVDIGNEFGCGIETKIFTHGAYIDSFNLGAPVQWAPVVIGDNVWMPNAWVNPGVKIGDNVIVAARSLVNRDIPSGSLAGGIPAEVLKENFLPRPLSQPERQSLVKRITQDAWKRFGSEPPVIFDNAILISNETVFNLEAKTITGPATPWTLLLKDQLRRNGIRFRFKPDEAGLFVPWKGEI